MLSRRSFIKTLAGAGAFSLAAPLWPSCTTQSAIGGRIWGANAATGHLLREGRFPEPTEQLDTDVLIIGGGIAGLSAARFMARNGGQKLLLLELDERVGGNSIGGENQASGHPWGAHYLPMPDKQQPELLAFLEETGVIEGYDSKGQPILNQHYVCHDPEERIYHHGAWYEGLVPSKHLEKKDREEFERFLKLMKDFQHAQGSDGKKVFALPLDHSSQDPAWLALDAITMEQWLQQQGFSSAFLYSYVDYCCRDDYGMMASQTSAWAGIHYLAARAGDDLQHADDREVVTWPEGNYWLVKQLQAQIADRCDTLTAHLVYAVKTTDLGVEALAFDTKKQQSVRILAKRVLMATPTFVSRRLLSHTPPNWLEAFTYAPWLVANITCKPFGSGQGAPLSWDNIIYDSPSLGYVHANHQQLKPAHDRHVLTYYYALCFQEPKEARRMALSYTHEQWANFVMQEMNKVHPGFDELVESIDIWIWGHGMVRPVPGFLWGGERMKASEPIDDRIFFAHSDLSGISVFEEAFYQGNKAGRQLLDSLA